MPASIVDQVVDFHANLFERIFTERFRPAISDRLRRNAVARQISEAADAASQSLSRFFLNQQLSPSEVTDLLAGLEALGNLLDLERVSNPNVTPESVVEELLEAMPLPEAVRQAGNEAVCRVALHSIIQVLMLVGPVMAEWQKLSFSSTFELPRRVVNRLNQISEQLDLLGRAGESVVDERYELTYRDHLLQRFHRVEAGTVRMTTNLAVDLRELFVMPRIRERPSTDGLEGVGPTTISELMDLSAARKIFQVAPDSSQPEPLDQPESLSAFAGVKKAERLVLIGTPGSGKSTFMEWLQLKLASVEEELILAGQQAIPLLLRVRQLNLKNLPQSTGLIEKATASHDRASLMPAGWIERQMQKGRVFLLLDGLDETEPEMRDCYLIPWLRDLCDRYPACHYLVSSRPIGYPPSALRSLGFVECDLLDFGPSEIAEYAQHWCTAVRLARNEPEAEARREGIKDGGEIIGSFQDNPYIRHLARNPLMLSAICLVSYFESGRLPEDRAVLYRLCVEGLLHHWDQRRGIRSEFTLEEKLRTSRHVALAMQSQDRAECPLEEIEHLFGEALGDHERSRHLLEHIRFRTGLLLERRPEIFAFAHLTFQEYLAACAIHEGNLLGWDCHRLAAEHVDARWNEVIALYCGLSTDESARKIVELLLAQPSTSSLASVLTEAYLSTKPTLLQNSELRGRVIKRVAELPSKKSLSRFPQEEVASIANRVVGTMDSFESLCEAHFWLCEHPEYLNFDQLLHRLTSWRVLPSNSLSELMIILHMFGSDELLQHLACEDDIYIRPGPHAFGLSLGSQAEIAIIALCGRKISNLANSAGFCASFKQIMQVLARQDVLTDQTIMTGIWLCLHDLGKKSLRLPSDREAQLDLADLVDEILLRNPSDENGNIVDALKNWVAAARETNYREVASHGT
jgi:hypothetical protein